MDEPRSPSRRARRPLRRSALALALCAAGAAACVREAPPVETPAPRPHLILISLDTLRADAVGPYRAGVSITPHLDRFAAGAVIVDRVLAPMPFTLAAHMTMFTGVSPTAHGVTTERDRLAPGIETLAQWLRRAGYRTAGRVTNEWLKGDFGFARGFHTYQRLRHGLTYAERVNAAGLEALEAESLGGAPVFLFLHYMDPHSDFGNNQGNKLPYYAPPDLLGDLAEDHRDDRYCDAEGRCATAFLNAADRDRRELTPARLAELHGLYEAGVRGLDRTLGELFDELRDRGLYDPSLIVVTSDHGEEFREHGRLLHSQTYEESVRVPLLIKLPGSARAGERIGGLADLADLPPTLLAALGLPRPAQVQGHDLLAIHRAGERGGGDEGVEGRRLALGQDKLVRSRYALSSGGFKLVHDLKSGESELYDLAADPGERRDLSEAKRQRTAALVARLDRELRAERRLGHELRAAEGGEPGEAEESVLGDEERERLKALGYL